MYSPFSPLSLRKMSLLFFSVKHPNQAEMPFCPPYVCTPLHPSPEISGLSSSPGSQWSLSSPLTSLLIPMPGCRCTGAVCPVGQIRKIPVFSRGQKFLLVPWGCCAVVEQTQTRGGRAGPLVSLPLSCSQGAPSTRAWTCGSPLASPSLELFPVLSKNPCGSQLFLLCLSGADSGKTTEV